MSDSHLLVEFDRCPSALRFMWDALRSSPGKPHTANFPPIVARWRRHRINRRELEEFREITGLPLAGLLPVLFPHVFGFRLQMVVLTHPTFPIPIWKALQIRNQIVQHRPVPTEAVLDLETRIAGHRVLKKGLEVDLHTRVSVATDPAWESINTFYYRGDFGEANDALAPPPAPDIGDQVVARWRLPSDVGWRFAHLTGDYNGIHHWDWYARRFGFRRAFFHSQMVVGQCMARLQGPHPEQPQQLKLWLKGPAYFGSDVALRADWAAEACRFALSLHGDERAAIVGQWGVHRS